MKKTLTTVIIAAITFCSGLLIGHRSVDKDDSITFIWNDDEESIPMDNTPILLEFGSKNSDTIYIGPLEQNPAEYQFVVTDDSITITDFGRKVGTVKLEGQLEKLIIKDNL
jgi:hypothetical protein